MTRFDSRDVLDFLNSGQVDGAPFGVIGFDSGCLVQVYNNTESDAAALSPSRVLGRHLFEVVAPCMNNYLVAQEFADALANRDPLDKVIDYVLTLKMKPTAVRLRLLASRQTLMRYLLIDRQ
jgi:photoactive yellow protein